MGTFIVFVVVVLALAYRGTTAEERAPYLQAARDALKQLATHVMRPPSSSFRDAVRARTPRVIVIPALVALNVVVFARVLFGTGALNDPSTLLAWGASVGPRTTNGEWWRLVTSAFVHARFLALLVNVAGLLQIGLLLERLVGGVAIAMVYLVACIFAGLASVSVAPVAVTLGASGALFGLYGLMLPVSLWVGYRGSDVAIPMNVVKRVVSGGAVCVVFNLWDAGIPAAGELAGFVAGIVCGLVLAIDVADRTAPLRHVVTATASALAIAVVCAAPLRGMTDARPEVARVVALETRTATEFQKADGQFRKGRLSGTALAQAIDRSIVPDLLEADARLKALRHVPPEHQPLVAGAEEYLRLRIESWRLRSGWLRQLKVASVREIERDDPASDAKWRVRAEAQHLANARTLGQAETAERASLEALRTVSAPEQK